MMRIERGAKRTAKPNIFISHSSRDKPAALRLATTLNFCAIDVWLDDHMRSEKVACRLTTISAVIGVSRRTCFCTRGS